MTALSGATAAAADCDASRSVAGVEDAMKAAAIASDPAHRRGFLDAAADRIDALADDVSRFGGGGALGEYIAARRADVARLAEAPGARDLTSSFVIVAVTSGVATGDCVEHDDRDEALDRQSDAAEAMSAVDEASKNEAEAAAEGEGGGGQGDAPSVRQLVSDFVERHEKTLRHAWVFAFIPMAAIVYRTAVFINRRRTVRYICCIPVSLAADDEVYEAKVFDFSRRGAKISIDAHAPRWENRSLQIRVGDLAVGVRMAWSERMIMGIVFDTPLRAHEMGEFFEAAEASAGLHRV